MTLNFDVIILGGGVAGMTAAIYLKRSNKNICIIYGIYISFPLSFGLREKGYRESGNT